MIVRLTSFSMLQAEEPEWWIFVCGYDKMCGLMMEMSEIQRTCLMKAVAYDWAIELVCKDKCGCSCLD